MKKLNLLLAILIGPILFSCSSNDNNSEENSEETIVVFKKASSYENSNLMGSQEVFYNSNNKATKIVTNIGNGYKITTINISYIENEINEITKTTDYGNSNNQDTIEAYNVTISNGQIRLTESNGVDYEIQFDFTGSYVDAYRAITPSDMNIVFEEVFLRNVDNNIVSHSIVGDLVFTYSNYDTGNIMPFHREYSLDYFIALGLKPSNKLPLTEERAFSSGNTNIYSIDPTLLTYDNINNIIRNGDDLNYVEYEYVKL